LIDIKDKLSKLIEHMAVETAEKKMYSGMVKTDAAHLKADRAEKRDIRD
jgi:hypothetical protein